MEYTEIGQSIRLKRLEKRMSQKDLHEATKVAIPTISKIENGADCKRSTLQKIANELGFKYVEGLKPLTNVVDPDQL